MKNEGQTTDQAKVLGPAGYNGTKAALNLKLDLVLISRLNSS